MTVTHFTRRANEIRAPECVSRLMFCKEATSCVNPTRTGKQAFVLVCVRHLLCCDVPISGLAVDMIRSFKYKNCLKRLCFLFPYRDVNTLRTGDADLRFQHGGTRYICKFSLVPLHKGECFQRYHKLKHY